MTFIVYVLLLKKYNYLKEWSNGLTNFPGIMENLWGKWGKCQNESMH